MNEQPTKRPNILLLGVAIVSVVLLLLVAWLAYRVQELSDAKQSKQTVQKSEDDTPEAIGYRTITSGQKGFTLTVPDGWGPLVNVGERDMMLVGGQKQPDVRAGAKTEVLTPKGFGGDSPAVFMAFMDTESSVPQGQAEPFEISKAENMLSGQKYVYRYDKDDVVGIGYQRYIGDRTYHYVFPIGDKDKELHVIYDVYGIDPRNHMELVEGIVKSIDVL